MKDRWAQAGRRRRATAALAIALALVSTLVVGTSASPASIAKAKKYKIAFNMGAEADPFFIAMNLGASQAAKALGVTLVWQGDPSYYSPTTQIPIVQQLLAEKPDALIISPTDPKALQPVVDKAIKQGVVVVNVDTHVNNLKKVISFVTGDNTQGGQAAADAMAKAMNYQDGKTYEVVVGASSPTTTTNTARYAGFKAEIAKKYPGIKIVDEEYSQSQPAVANTNVNNWLTKYPNLKGIFAIDGTNAAGAAAALQAHNLVGKIALIGYDAYANNVELLKKGVFAALIAQQPALEGSLTMKYAVKYLRTHKKKGIPHLQVLPNIVLTPTSSEAMLAKYTYPTA
jgi:ribose transport system substrate-binding protein